MSERKAIDSEDWLSPAERALARQRRGVLMSTYATSWVEGRPLKPRTASHYRSLLERFIQPTFGDLRVEALTPAFVRAWHQDLCPEHPTQRAHVYHLLKAICKTAVDDELLPSNPCRVVGAGQARRASRTTPATLAELEAIVDAIPVRYRAMVLLAAWCALRLGELSELRRSDIDLVRSVVRVRRAVTWVDSAAIVGSPKSEAGVRDVAIPPHLIPAVRAHLDSMVLTGADALLFPAAHDPHGHLRTATLYKVYYRAREVAGRPDLRFHDLRHTGAVFATLTGASLPEVMARLGHSTPGAAMRYQHAASGRDAAIASALSELAKGPNR